MLSRQEWLQAQQKLRRRVIQSSSTGAAATSAPSATTSKPPHEDVTDVFVQCLHMFLVDCNEDLYRDGLSLTFDELGRGVAFEDVRALIPAGTGIVETLEAAGAVSKSGPAMVRVRAQCLLKRRRGQMSTQPTGARVGNISVSTKSGANARALECSVRELAAVALSCLYVMFCERCIGSSRIDLGM